MYTMKQFHGNSPVQKYQYIHPDLYLHVQIVQQCLFRRLQTRGSRRTNH